MGIIVPNIHSQILPLIIDVNLSSQPDELQENLYKLKSFFISDDENFIQIKKENLELAATKCKENTIQLLNKLYEMTKKI